MEIGTENLQKKQIAQVNGRGKSKKQKNEVPEKESQLIA